MFTQLNCLGFLLVAGLFATAFGFYRLRKNLERWAGHLTAEIDATDDALDKLEGQVDALFAGIKAGQAKTDALDQYVQELPTFDDLADFDTASTLNLAARLRGLADAVESDARFELTQEDLESGAVRFADPEMYERTGIRDPAAEDSPGSADLSGAGFEVLVLPCDCPPGEPRCVPACMPEACPGVSESIVGTIPDAPRCDDRTCGG